jgi:hypothetical protein
MIDKFLYDEQDPKTVEKIYGKLRDFMGRDEELIYIAVQKKPAVTINPDCIAVTSKRIIFCIPENMGLTMRFLDFNWRDIKEVSFKEEFFGAKFITVPQKGENLTIFYIPKIQARKLYQSSYEQLEKVKEEQRQHELDEKKAGTSAVTVNAQPSEPVQPVAETDDEITQKLKRLKVLFEKQLISAEEYESKKRDILSQL